MTHAEVIVDGIKEQLLAGFEEFRTDIESILRMSPVPLRDANLPNEPGVYLLSVEDFICYVGEAKGSQGLRDRVLSKHVSGDDNHAIQRAYKEQFPNRNDRREFIKSNVYVRWISIHDTPRIAVIERLLIWLLRPQWNKK